MVLRMSELGEQFYCIFTRTGNELPEVHEHIARIVDMVSVELVCPPGPTLDQLIHEFHAVPNGRMRWCTRMIKIVPCIAHLKKHFGTTLCVGLRADEPQREGLYGEYATYRYPLREWGWEVKDVLAYCEKRGANVPRRTDCAVCYDQRLIEWWYLWHDYPDLYAQGEEYEAFAEHTFRSRSRDTWPAGLKELRQRFEAGDKPTRSKLPGEEYTRCRICRT